jgi:putative peptidoglycan lipid II flippase
MSRSLFSATFVLSLALLAGRLTGLLRELGLATVFGISPQADLAVLLLTLPDLLVNLLISGGISAALVPRFSTLQDDEALVLFRQFSLAILAIFGVAAGGLILYPQVVFHLLAPGVNAESIGTHGLVAVAVALPLSGVAGVTGAYLNSRQRFMLVGCGTLFFNVGVLIALFLCRHHTQPLSWLAFGILAGAALRWVTQMMMIPSRVWYAPATKRVVDHALLRAFMFATLAAAMSLLAPVVIRAMASTLGEGAVASFNYAQKLVELPVTILLTSIGTVALSRMSIMYSEGKPEQAMALAVQNTRYALLLGATILLFGWLFAAPAVHVVFAASHMDEASLSRIAGLTAVATLSAPCAAVTSIATALLNASSRAKDVFKVSAGTLSLLPVLALPGLLLKSENALMFAVVGSQAVAAIWLSRIAQLPMLGRGALWKALASSHFGMVLTLALACAGIAQLIEPSHNLLRVLLAAAGFLIAMAVPIRRFLRFSTDSFPQSAVS